MLGGLVFCVHLHTHNQRYLYARVGTLMSPLSNAIVMPCCCLKFTKSHINTLVNHCCSFPLGGESPKQNIIVVIWALVICLKYMHLHLNPHAHAYNSDKSLVPMLQLLHIVRYREIFHLTFYSY